MTDATPQPSTTPAKQYCGHPMSETVSSSEGTSYCAACEREASTTPDAPQTCERCGPRDEFGETMADKFYRTVETYLTTAEQTEDVDVDEFVNELVVDVKDFRPAAPTSITPEQPTAADVAAASGVQLTPEAAEATDRYFRKDAVVLSDTELAEIRERHIQKAAGIIVSEAERSFSRRADAYEHVRAVAVDVIRQCCVATLQHQLDSLRASMMRATGDGDFTAQLDSLRGKEG